MYNIPATEFLVDSSFIKSNHINTNTRWRQYSNTTESFEKK